MGSKVLVIHCTGATVRAAVVDEAGATLARVGIEGLGATPRLVGGAAVQPVAVDDIRSALLRLFDELLGQGLLAGLVAVGHRIAHGGDRYSGPALVDARVEADIQALGRLAPLHNPAALDGIRAARERWPTLAQVAVFDTAFHTTLPRRAREYALPRELVARLGLRRYGFQGISHDFVTCAAADWLGIDRARLRLISCHLGAGASVTAVEYGRSVETSMGMTALEGLVMDTRPGDLDPGVVIELLRSGLGVDELERVLQQESGLAGLAGSSDMREVERRARSGDAQSRLALQVYAHRVRKYLGAYAAVMGGVDAIVFTGGVGEHSASLRQRIAERLEFLGAEIDEDRNRDASVGAGARVAEISVAHARCKVLVVATDEDAAIAAATRRVYEGGHAVQSGCPIPIAISVRHVHLSAASVAALFGPGRTLTVARYISQPGQFAAAETVTLIGPAGRLEHVRVVGPVRGQDQVEISRTDEFVLGVDAPVRESGDLARTPGVRIEGPAGAVELRTGVICSLRHIHMTPADAAAFGVRDGDRVDVHVDSDGRELTYGEVRIRVRDDFRLEMHVDTDEANAAGLASGAAGLLEGVHPSARMIARR